MMKYIQSDVFDSYDFSNYLKDHFINTTAGCQTDFPTAPATFIAACQKIVTEIGNATMFEIYVSDAAWFLNHNNKGRVSIAVALPGAKKYYCISSSGGTSQLAEFDSAAGGPPAGLGSGCGGTTNQWLCSGCYGATD